MQIWANLCPQHSQGGDKRHGRPTLEVTKPKPRGAPMLSVDELLVLVYSLVDDILSALVAKLTQNNKLRSRGPDPNLTDSEVITMMIVGELLGHKNDEAIHEYFSRHWTAFFPNLGDRSSFVRQSANLWVLYEKMHRAVIRFMGALEETIHIVDGFPMIVSNINRASRARLFKGLASRGHCEAKKLKFYGFKGHISISSSGIITEITVTAANADEREAMWEILDGIVGIVLGDKGYISRFLAKCLHQEQSVDLRTPLRKNMKPVLPHEHLSFPGSIRRRIETIIGQLAERFGMERVLARDVLHLTSRVRRKILAHTIGMWLLRKMGIETMELDRLVA